MRIAVANTFPRRVTFALTFAVVVDLVAVAPAEMGVGISADFSHFLAW